MQSMEPRDATAGSSDRRKEPGRLQTPTEESLCLKVETGSTKSKEPEADKTSHVESKKRATGKEALVRKPPNATRFRNHLRPKSKRGRVDNSTSTSYEDLEESSSNTESDTTDSDPFTKRQAPKSRKSSRASKARPQARKDKSRRKSSLLAKTEKQAQSSSGSDTDAIMPTDIDEVKRSHLNGRDATRSEIYDHIDRLELRISQLQSQMAQTTTFPHLSIYGVAPAVQAGIGLPNHLGNFPPPASNDNPPKQSASFVTPPSKCLGRLDLVPRAPRGFRGGSAAPRLESQEPAPDSGRRQLRRSSKNGARRGTKIDFKRVDWVWDSSLYTHRLQDTAELSMSSMYDDYIFHVRRTFDCEGKYRATFVDIRSKLLRECLQDVIGNVRGASLVDETPKLDPNLLFLYLEDFRTHLKHLKRARPAGDDKKERKKNGARLESKRKQLEVLIRYLDKDYAKVKESLYPMLDSGVITFDLLWALWKPNTLVYSTTYGAAEDPRVFKVDMAYRQSTIMRGDLYFIEGKYLEFDGKKFGYGTVAEEISDFQGARKITSLPCYPLSYHKEHDRVQKDLVQRGKKFVALNGVHYKCYSGIAYMKRKRGSVLKFNVQQSRVMVDPAIFRRINPNYSVSAVRSRNHDALSDQGSDDESVCCECASDGGDERERVEFVSKVFKSERGDVFVAKMPRPETEAETEETTLRSLPGKVVGRAGKTLSESSAMGGGAAETPMETAAEVLPDFSEDDYLIASPVVFGFSFSEKQWLEFSVSAVKDISWNEKAWESLVLEPETKDLIQALVQSRKYHATQTIDDVIQGKGKGLVTVLHGPPGTGKTLTAEGISELLKCPLYMASAGELGTDSRHLEAELQKILDICHAWGAILLLDEADVFLEKRNMQDIHRNALVSIFLRQLEYFQGILFLTTNRVETFDEAFQSRIHVALRYDALDAKAKKTIFKMFLDRIKAFGKLELQPFSEEDLDDLARHDLNGREIKNVVGSAQDLAVSKGESFSMRHIRQVLDVHAKFGRDLRGGAGYEDAMRSYF